MPKGNKETTPARAVSESRLDGDFVPLVEKAVRRDGTIGIKVIGEGWGASGYYGRKVLERDVPSVFPAGTHMYWNHPTLSENEERPERDLRDLAAVTVSDPRWHDDGPAGPGMYADARVFSGYQDTINEIAEHIGVSIRGSGKVQQGEAQGKTGRIVEEISDGFSVDFVTKPGAGGAVVNIFESAPGAKRLPDLEEMLKEAANLGEWLESRLHLSLTQIADDLFGDGHVTRDERKALSAAIGQALDAYHNFLEDNAPDLFSRKRWEEAPAGTQMSESEPPEAAKKNKPEERMSELQEVEAARDKAQADLAEARRQLAERDGQLAKASEALLLREARDFVQEQLAEAELPDLTKKRLAQSLAANPILADGKLDKEAIAARVTKAVEEAEAEVNAILGFDGRVRGHGNGAPANGALTIEEAQKMTAGALADLGYGKRQEDK